MDNQKASFSIKSYKDDEHIRILNSVLSKWLTNPKILHFTAPNIQYPYNINNWISTSYNDENTQTHTIEIDNWIIGHLSAKLNNKTNPPKLIIEFFENQKNIKNISCYSNDGGYWKKSDLKFDKNTITVNFKDPFVPRRGRINCSLNENGQWKWFGTQFTIRPN